ncbi:hypothetical protein [Methylophilus sp. QUAN]|uniref:hypothetical protein n=1 Tax=Methylophilus sp. QUAN TaxID=2781020 RepID=UPI00188FE6AB|nr:hypothetical protein [Methylophilus sp. QUAN]MBF4990966.1 hypothetical protein [Methylophilus sp. QUAN]
MINAPNGDGNWYFVENYTHLGGSHWQTQIAYGMTNPGKNYSRTKVNGTWAGWTLLGATSQSYQNVSSARCNNCTYSNNTGQTITVIVRYFYSSTQGDINVYVDNQQITFEDGAASNSFQGSVTFPVPNNSSYRVLAGNGIISWWELR